MTHASGCTGLHTTCAVCADDSNLNVCVTEFGAPELCPQHDSESKRLTRATEAYRNISFYPEQAAASHLASLTRLIDGLRTEHLEVAISRGNESEYLLAAESIALRVVKLDEVVLARRGRTISWAITGRGNFPVARNEKAQASERRAIEELDAYVERASARLSRIARGAQIMRVGDANAETSALGEVEKLEALREAFKSANSAARKGEASLNAYMATLDGETQSKILEYARYSGSTAKPIPSFALTNLNARIKRLQNKAETAARVQAISVDHISIDGATVEIDRADDRLRIRHANRPGADVIADLKSHGFRWSPSNAAWQRPVTPQAVARAEQLARKWAQ